MRTERHGAPVSNAIRPVQYRMLSEEVYEQLRQLILDGDLTPGLPLAEQALAEQFEVSRSPVRDALQKLVLEGLVVRDRHQRIRVRRTSVEEVRAAYAVREKLEGLAARLAATEGDRRFLAALLGSVRGMEAASDPAALDCEHSRFHDTLAEMSGNLYVIRYLAELSRFRTRAVPVKWMSSVRVQNAIAEHRPIYEAIERQDPEAAEEAASFHVQRTGRALIARLSRSATD